MASSVFAIRQRTPALGSSFAVWRGLYSTFDCALAKARGREDAWNSIGSGALTGGVLAARSGLAGSVKSAAIGAVMLGMIEGVMFIATRQPPNYGSYLPQDDEDALEDGEGEKSWFKKLAFWEKESDSEKSRRGGAEATVTDRGYVEEQQQMHFPLEPSAATEAEFDSFDLGKEYDFSDDDDEDSLSESA